VFVHDEEQRKAAEASRARTAERIGAEVRTEILPATRFWMAEDYHQKYSLRSRRDVMATVRPLFPDEAAFAASTAVARINAHLGGDLPLDRLRRELRPLGLEPLGETRLEGVRRID